MTILTALLLTFSFDHLMGSGETGPRLQLHSEPPAADCTTPFRQVWQQADFSKLVASTSEVVIQFTKVDGGYRSRVYFGTTVTREQTETADNCDEVARATTAYVIAALSDANSPEIIQAASQPTTPRPPPSGSAMAAHNLRLMSGVSVGLVGPPTWNLQLGSAVHFEAPLKIGVTLGWHFPQTNLAPYAFAPVERFSRSLIHLTSDICFEPLRSTLVLALCAEGLVGAMFNEVPRSVQLLVQTPQALSSAWFALGLGAEALVPMSRHLALLVKAEVLFPLVGTFVVLPVSSPAFKSSVVGGVVSLGIGWDPS